MILVKEVKDEDIVNYKYTSMFVAFPHCTFKCDRESGVRCCQNSALALQNGIAISEKTLAKRYMSNSLTKALVIGGLEPFDDIDDLIKLVSEFRKHTNDEIVIYTGYKECEIVEDVLSVFEACNKTGLIVKFGRFVPNSAKRFDGVLGVVLASENQYAKRIEDNGE